MNDGLILSVRHRGRGGKVWVYRPHDATLFVDEAKNLVDVLHIEPASNVTAHGVTCAVGWLFPLELLEKFQDIQWIQSTSSGLDHLEAYRQRHPTVVLTAMQGLNADIVAEYALAHVLAIRWRIITYHEQGQQKVWRGYKTPDGAEIRALIIGLGNIGQRIAHHLSGLGMSVMAVRRDPAPSANIDRVFGFDQLHAALSMADYVILSLPLTPETRHIVGKEEFLAMKAGSHLINLSRGGVVDENALALALRGHQIGGAVLDVTEQEPYPVNGPLWDVPNLLITPHVAGEHEDFARRAARRWASNLQSFLSEGVKVFRTM